MKYLIVKCKELGDQWECDADRTPIKMVDDYSEYGVGYEVYELQNDNSFKLIKDYDTCQKRGFAIYRFNDNDKVEKVYEKYEDLTRENIIKSQIKKWKQLYGFKATIKEICQEIDRCGGYGETINDKWTVMGEYFDDCYSLGC